MDVPALWLYIERDYERIEWALGEKSRDKLKLLTGEQETRHNSSNLVARM